jgi:hypothetical protein
MAEYAAAGESGMEEKKFEILDSRRIATAVEVRPGRWKSLSTSLTRRLRAVFFIQCIVISSAKIHANFMPEHMNHVVALKMSRHR